MKKVAFTFINDSISTFILSPLSTQGNYKEGKKTSLFSDFFTFMSTKENIEARRQKCVKLLLKSFFFHFSPTPTHLTQFHVTMIF
ncbi:CLUMA_CG014590, isoform A [Clunio marinus]|uniref:CLUMA_CG014590, isoform A n=1 Tax=Clunio marinus TaxID=568069 RepID=A0A1J1IP74_9DIPT|nr:CLUMA_CG014590, isoform A [Clunio marinus]